MRCYHTQTARRRARRRAFAKRVMQLVQTAAKSCCEQIERGIARALGAVACTADAYAGANGLTIEKLRVAMQTVPPVHKPPKEIYIVKQDELRKICEIGREIKVMRDFMGTPIDFWYGDGGLVGVWFPEAWGKENPIPKIKAIIGGHE